MTTASREAKAAVRWYIGALAHANAAVEADSAAASADAAAAEARRRAARLRRRRPRHLPRRRLHVTRLRRLLTNTTVCPVKSGRYTRFAVFSGWNATEERVHTENINSHMTKNHGLLTRDSSFARV